jgi:hypothetical protein
MALKDAIDEIVDELQTISGIRRVPDEPPEKTEQFPFAVVYPVNGQYRFGPPPEMRALHNIAIELHVARRDLPRDFNKIMELIDTIPKEMWNKLRAGSFSNLDTFGGGGADAPGITYTFGPLSWGAVETLGVTYTMNDVKILTDVSA